MQLRTSRLSATRGWSALPTPELDSERTLALVIAAPRFVNESAHLEQLRAALPRSRSILCSTAGEILGERAEEELEATLQRLPPGAQQVGFYGYGEISPFATGHCDLHDQTMALTTLFEVSR